MVAFKVMQQLSLGNQHYLDQFLNLQVAYLGVGEDLAHEVYGPLDLKGVPEIVPLHNECRADHLHGGGDVNH
jgi:hypothetical protein